MKDNNIKFPVITTSRLILRELTKQGAADLHKYWSDSDVLEYLSLDPFTSIKESLDMISVNAVVYEDVSDEDAEYIEATLGKINRNLDE